MFVRPRLSSRVEMLPTLALLAGFALVLLLFARDMRWRQLSSSALWIPGIWLAMGSSRQLGFWFTHFGLSSGGSRLEGSPVNVVFNNALFLAALVVLYRRKFSWAKFAFANQALFLMYAYFLCSAIWSPFPVPTAKRLIQQFGWVLVAPIILTERDVAASLRTVFVRVAYVLIPLSVPLMKYFPSVGRAYSYHGAVMMSGVADHKNSLGQLCMVFCLVLIWDLMETRKLDPTSSQRPEAWPRLLTLGIGFYLLWVSVSATSWLCFLLCVVLLIASKRLARMNNAKRVVMVGAFAAVCLLAVEQAYDLSTRVSEAFGRGAGMSGRSEIWRVALERNANHLIGWGFQAFWDTSDGAAAYEELGTGELNTAHNGYIETYLNGGVIGLSLLALFIWSTGLKATAKLVEGNPIGRLAVVFWPVLLVYNLTESQFLMTGPIWFAMLLVTFDWRPNGHEGETVRVKRTWQERRLLRPHGSRFPVVSDATVVRSQVRTRQPGPWRSSRGPAR